MTESPGISICRLLWLHVDDFGIAGASAVEFGKAFRGLEIRHLRFLDEAERAGREPVAVARGEERGCPEALAIRRVGKDERECGADAAGARPELCRVALVELRVAVESERFEIFANGGAAFRVIVDEKREGGMALIDI